VSVTTSPGLLSPAQIWNESGTPALAITTRCTS
jgi:hypothetical protein